MLRKNTQTLARIGLYYNPEPIKKFKVVLKIKL